MYRVGRVGARNAAHVMRPADSWSSPPSRSRRRIVFVALVVGWGSGRRGADDVDVGGGEDGVECGNEFGVAVAVAVADQESEARAGAILREAATTCRCPTGRTRPPADDPATLQGRRQQLEESDRFLLSAEEHRSVLGGERD